VSHFDAVAPQVLRIERLGVPCAAPEVSHIRHVRWWESLPGVRREERCRIRFRMLRVFLIVLFLGVVFMIGPWVKRNG